MFQALFHEMIVKMIKNEILNFNFFLRKQRMYISRVKCQEDELMKIRIIDWL